MRTRSARRTPAAVVAVAAVTGTLAWAPTASAHAPEPTPSTSTSPPPRNMPETGGVQILKKDPGGDVLSGVAFTLLDDTGKEIASGKTNGDGQLVFKDFAAGVYRLKETSSGSPLYDVVADQDVIVTAGQASPLTVIDPFKPADLTVKKTDKSSGEPLAGAVINVTPDSGAGDTVTLTTGKDGTAKAQLPVTSRSGTIYTATERKAPDDYQLDAKPLKLTAKPGAPVTVTLNDTKKEQPTKPPTTPPTSPGTTTPGKPSAKPTPGPSKSDKPSAPSSDTPVAEDTTSSTAAPAPEGSLAHTGADATPWLLGGAGLLLAAGGAAVIVARRRRMDDDQNNEPDES
ncbi:SpaA isopeptide-forming pilin-related protein [Streptomyces olivoreticuli]